MKLIGKTYLSAGLILMSAGVASASSIWNEVNAGGQISSADVTAGAGPLTGIIGVLADTTSGADMYEILITNPGAFSATTIGNTNKPVVDPALYLFDANGLGLFGNDNTSNLNTQATIPVGTTTLLAPGVYYLLITPSGNLPQDKNGNSIFGAITGTTGVNSGAGVLKKYGGTPSADDAGKGYEILLTGAGFASPEPGTVAFALFGIAAFALRARRRSR